jgi:osmotically-inducible protein OsmY
MIRSIRNVWCLALAVVLLGWAPSVFAQGPRDAKLALKAQQKIYKNAGMIDVEVQAMSGFLYLRGTVSDEEASKSAEDLAKVPGAKEVRNRLKVGEIDVAAASDDQIQAGIAEKIAADEDLSKSKLDVAVTDGNVSVEGKVSDYTVAGTLISDIRKVEGVKSIDFEKLNY